MFYLFLLAHLLADFPLQSTKLVGRKRHWDGLLIHVAIVLGCMLALPLLEPATAALWPAMLVISAVHLAIDRVKVRYGDRLQPPILPFLLDQGVHLATLAIVLGLTLPPELVWGLETWPDTVLALYVSGYILVGVATPIALMLLLDPHFEHVALAPWARFRSLLVGSAVLTIALLGSYLALLATLLGLTLMVRRPASAHPLDKPVGLLAVALVAALTGAALVLAL